MQMSKKKKKTLEEQIEEINETLRILQQEQKKEIDLLQKNHAINMKKIDKIQEYNKISDMTNQIFEKRLLGIEKALIELNANLKEAK